MTPLDLQFYNLAVMVLAGVALGICLDTYRVLRGLWRPGWVGTALGDLLFGLVCGLLLAAALFLGNSGEVRLYVFLGIIAGYALYQELGGGPYRRRLTACLRLVGWTVRALARAIARGSALIAMFLVLLLEPFFWLANMAAKSAGLLGRPVLALGRPAVRLAKAAGSRLGGLAGRPLSFLKGFWKRQG